MDQWPRSDQIDLRPQTLRVAADGLVNFVKDVQAPKVPTLPRLSIFRDQQLQLFLLWSETRRINGG